MRRLILATAALLAVAQLPAYAQPADVPALIKMIETQPADMDRSAWKEKRREAARKLVATKDKRAVPQLIKLVETETFDIIGEIAIEGLGNMGDQSAVPALQKAANDNTRDKATRDLAKKALAKLGSDANVVVRVPAGGGTTTTTTGNGTTTTGGGTTTTTTGGGTTTTTGGGTATTTGGGAVTTGDTGGEVGTGLEGGSTEGGGTTGGGTLIGAPKAPEGVPEGPALSDDTIAAYDRLTIAAGTASLAYDTVRKRASFSADVAGRWQHRIEREKMAWGYDFGGHLVTGLINPEGRESTRGAQLGLEGAGEARFYTGKVYGIGKAAIGFQLNYISSLDDDNPMEDLKDTRYTADIQVALGGGYGRIVDVGAAIRVRRLARTLDANRALGKQIDAATSKRLQLAWWALRGERGSYRSLVATVAILREAGILLGEPDAGLAYELLTVLQDSQLFMRPEGVDVQLVIAEGYLMRDEEDMIADPEVGRIEQVILTAGYGKQLADDKAEASGSAFARARLLAPDTQPSPWALGATARLKRFAYGDHGDPIGAFDVSATLILSNDSEPAQTMPSTDPKTALRIQGEAGFTWWLNRASGLRAAATIAEDAGEIFFGASLEATYGLLDGLYAR
ncbi:MAG: HEAT repeat domain-containing protein [Deltaproteobacteria bacterium]|nr:HEAT repeat domain-containing protein [Deltaproteobacteria bacterium]